MEKRAISKSLCIVLGSCDPIEGCEIESYDTEREVLLKWTELIQREDPDIIIGYNIFGFDYSFMFNRADELRCQEEFLQLSRVQDEVAANEVNNRYQMEKTMLKIASGEYDLQYYKMKKADYKLICMPISVVILIYHLINWMT